MTFRLLLAAATLALGSAAPSAASWSAAGAPAATVKKPVESTKVPEPADFILFAAGIGGLLLGRRGSRSRQKKD